MQSTGWVSRLRCFGRWIRYTYTHTHTHILPRECHTYLFAWVPAVWPSSSSMRTRREDVVALVPLVLTSTPYKTSHYSHLPVFCATITTAAITVLLFPFFWKKKLSFFASILFLFGNCESFGWCLCMNASGSRVRSISGNFVSLSCVAQGGECDHIVTIFPLKTNRNVELRENDCEINKYCMPRMRLCEPNKYIYI